MSKRPPIREVLNINETALNAYSTGLLQGKAYRLLSERLSRTLFRFDLSIPEWKMLGQLAERGEMRLSELAELLDVRPPLVTKLVDDLEKKEYVRRVPDPIDSRARLISATVRGKALIPVTEKAVKKILAELLVGVSRRELLIYLRVLAHMVDNAR